MIRKNEFDILKILKSLYQSLQRPSYIFDYVSFLIPLQVDVNSALGYSKLLLYANNPPVNGTCELNYNQDKVYVLETLVR